MHTSLANKYRPRTFNDVVEQDIIVKMLKSICSAPELDCRNFLLIGPAGTGKANTLDTEILSVDGYVKMRDIRLGDKVFTHSGSIGSVTGIYPQGVRPIYRITLQDNTYIDVSDNHLNLVSMYDEDSDASCDMCLTTNDLIELFKSNGHRLYIDSPLIDWEHKDVPVHPYLFGLISGSRSFYEKKVCTDIDSDIMTNMNSIDIQNISDISATVAVLLSESDVQYIPHDYLFTDRAARLELLRGLLDAAELSTCNGSIKWSTTNKQLSNDFAFLCRSLGLKDTIIHCSEDVYLHSIEISYDIFQYLNKFQKYNTMALGYFSSPMRSIVSIDYIGNKECQCIMIDHDDHSYLCNNGIIPTHNTTLARCIANSLNNGESSVIEIDAASHSGIDAIRELIVQARAYPVGSKYKVFIIDECHALSSSAWQALLLPLEAGVGRSVFVLCTTNPEKIPATILSRVQTFQLSKISLSGIHNRIEQVLDEEIHEGRNIRYDHDATLFIAKLANGGLRDSLTLLDKALTYSSDLTIDTVEKALNLPDYDQYFNLLNAYAKHDNSSITLIINDVYDSGVNFVKWFEGFHQFIINIVKYIYLKDINLTMIPSTYESKISQYTEKHSMICLNLASKLLRMNHELKTTQYLQEVALTYLCSVNKGGK